MNSIQFEKLLEQFMLGELNLESYRIKRSELIKEIVNNEIYTDITIPKTEIIAPKEIEIEKEISTIGVNVETNNDVEVNVEKSVEKSVINSIENNSSFQVPTIVKQDALPPSPIIKYSIFALIAILVTSFSWYASDALINKASKNPDNSTLSTQTSTHSSEALDETFIIAFIQKNQWNPDTLNNFVKQWEMLSPNQQGRARQSASFNQVSKDLLTKIKQQKNLKDTKKTNPTKLESLLIWFASKLSIGIT